VQFGGDQATFYRLNKVYCASMNKLALLMQYFENSEPNSLQVCGSFISDWRLWSGTNYSSCERNGFIKNQFFFFITNLPEGACFFMWDREKVTFKISLNSTLWKLRWEMPTETGECRPGDNKRGSENCKICCECLWGQGNVYRVRLGRMMNRCGRGLGFSLTRRHPLASSFSITPI
jgi:hypothetical protein